MPSEALSLPRPRLLRKYFNICRVSLIERLAYRGDFFLSTVLRFLPLVTTILLWHAIYAEVVGGEIANFSLRDMIAYLLLVHISRMFSSMPGLAFGIARDIRDGNLKKYLLQPIDMIAYLVSYRVAHKIAYIITSAIPYGLVFFFCRDYFADLSVSAATWAAYAAALVLAFLIGFFFEACIGMIGFWFLEVTSLLYIINTINFFVSGQMFPLDLLPPFWVGLLRALPFQYLAYFPAALLLGKIEGPQLTYGLLGAFAWTAVLITITRLAYRLGLRRYSAYGG